MNDDFDGDEEEATRPEVRLSITLSSGLTQEVAWVYAVDQDAEALLQASKMVGYDGGVSPVFSLLVGTEEKAAAE